jgi:hypothetical protein
MVRTGRIIEAKPVMPAMGTHPNLSPKMYRNRIPNQKVGMESQNIAWKVEK